jgi:hypothetical protein
MDKVDKQHQEMKEVGRIKDLNLYSNIKYENLIRSKLREFY